jgi:hypothetical protein
VWTAVNVDTQERGAVWTVPAQPRLPVEHDGDRNTDRLLGKRGHESRNQETLAIGGHRVGEGVSEVRGGRNPVLEQVLGRSRTDGAPGAISTAISLSPPGAGAPESM